LDINQSSIQSWTLNTRDRLRAIGTLGTFSGYVGFVTEFDVSDEMIVRYPIQVAGASVHRELWVPAAELAAFNSNIVAPIRVVEAYPGPKFAGAIDPGTNLPVD